MGFVFEVLALARAYADYTLFAHPDLLPGGEVMRSLTPWLVGPSLLLGAVLLILLFPDGKLPTSLTFDPALVNRTWRIVVWMAVGGAALVYLWWVTWPEGALDVTVETLGRLGGASLALSCVAAVFSVFFRLQSAEGRERQQIKWFAYGAAVFLGAFFFFMGAAIQIGGPWAGFVVIVTGFSAIPVAVGIAILRYRLYDIDVLINRTLVYGSLTVMLALVYFGGVTATHALLRTLTGQEQLPQLIVVASTLVIAAPFNPLRRRIQAFIDRSFSRRKYDAAKTLEGYSMKLRDETDLNALSDDLVGVVRETMQPAHVSLWLHPHPALKDKKKRAAIRESGRVTRRS
jgi:hypothetical protein